MGKARRLSRLLHAELTERFPIAFPKDYEAIKPLKIGIYEDLCEALGEDVDKAILKTALKNQTSRDGYLLALMRQDHRIDLQGQPAGTITEDAKALASKKIEVSQRRQQEKAEEENRRLQEEKRINAIKKKNRDENEARRLANQRRREQHQSRVAAAIERKKRRQRQRNNTETKPVIVIKKKRRRTLSLRTPSRQGSDDQ